MRGKLCNGLDRARCGAVVLQLHEVVGEEVGVGGAEGFEEEEGGLVGGEGGGGQGW